MQVKLLQIVPKCLDDGTLTKARDFTIKTSGGDNFLYQPRYCPKCESYLTNEGMERDVRKAALGHIRLLDTSYELSDIVEVKRAK
tara:strand:+ start:679 stop:933 length:255 start_codon:yes stop_codon:yes gene_type:complete